jgi:copper transport protein
VLLVLGIVALWRFTPPPRVLAAAARVEEPAEVAVREPIRTHLHSSGIMADLEIVGEGPRTVVAVQLYPEDGDADVRSVRILLTPPVPDAVPLDLDAALVGEAWSAPIPSLTAGRWVVVVEVRVGDFDLVKMKGAIRVE